ncbi:DUF1178 family protein [Sphingomonas sp. BK580]|uniref:DUF1178 family protein n=1 Tax=Sphingomonas sp. BK580 TaxID=2586972 RepID=UPI001610EF62|nr:DUF1178 family protein [Sphingomonas sp. BK580]MBB3692245.1 hypothetical protein [Sphingomonas sp. BK580]
MIVFDLRCTQAHVFEAWFASTTAYEEQRERGLVSCPTCGDTVVEKAVMAPNVGAKGNRAPAVVPPGSPAEVLRQLASRQAELLRRSRWVGSDFAAEARALHEGERSEGAIHGQASAAEVSELIEDGVPVAPLLFPVAPPDQIN